MESDWMITWLEFLIGSGVFVLILILILWLEKLVNKKVERDNAMEL